MKLPITDQFLWSVYKFFEITEDVLEPPDVFKLKGWSRIGPCLGQGYWKNLERKRAKKQFAQFLNYLKSRGYIKIANLKEKQGILLTKEGQRKALRIDVGLAERRKRKDKKWIMLMYDIPEKKRRERVSFRQLLQSLGYQYFQKSIWVCPYDVFKETEEIIRIYSLDSYVKVFLIEEVII